MRRGNKNKVELAERMGELVKIVKSEEGRKEGMRGKARK
jgi:hypothetical protein